MLLNRRFANYGFYVFSVKAISMTWPNQRVKAKKNGFGSITMIKEIAQLMLNANIAKKEEVI